MSISEDTAWDLYCEAEKKMCEAAAAVLNGMDEEEITTVHAQAYEAQSDVMAVCEMLLGLRDVPSGWQITPLSEVSEKAKELTLSPNSFFDARSRNSLLAH